MNNITKEIPFFTDGIDGIESLSRAFLDANSHLEKFLHSESNSKVHCEIYREYFQIFEKSFIALADDSTDIPYKKKELQTDISKLKDSIARQDQDIESYLSKLKDWTMQLQNVYSQHMEVLFNQETSDK